MSAPGTLNASLAQLTSNNLGIRLAEGDPGFIDASQALRYRVFYEEMTAKPTEEMAARKRDFDAFDAVADHLLVVDRDLGDGPESVVGTYRLTRREAAARHGQFYTVDEYDISALTGQPGEILELGRSCVDEAYRTRHVMELLWRGIAAYVFHYDIDLMFGCASIPGTDPDALALPLSYLYHNHLAPPEKRPVALAERHVEMNRLPADQIDRRQGLAAVPPLIKGYLRLGGYVGDGAVIDPQFDTTDVCIVVETHNVTGRYYKHYSRKAGEGSGAEGSGDERG
ncbi:MAG: GNAT family N-acyltransferase [Alphaproteobacteria bacterium]|nr:GNAT family N-acyltransferase [Alphaproteobacteria bacterium]